MKEQLVKDKLTELLSDHQLGYVLQIAADLYSAVADEARRADDRVTCDKATTVAHALAVFGYGVDAVLPKGAPTAPPRTTP